MYIYDYYVFIILTLMKCLLLLSLIFLVLEFLLSVMLSIASHYLILLICVAYLFFFLWRIFFLIHLFSTCLCLYLEHISNRWYIVGFYFYICASTLWLFTSLFWLVSSHLMQLCDWVFIYHFMKLFCFIFFSF